MKKMNKKAFTLIELIVVVAVVGILVLLGMPRFIGYKDKAELARIQHDVKVMEQEVGTVLVSNGDEFNSWEDNSKDLNQLAQENKLAEKEGIAEAPIGGSYKVIPEKYKDKINTKLKGTFYANKDGKVYYEHEKPIASAEPEEEPGYSDEEEPGYSDEEIGDLIKEGVIPVATADELNSIRDTSTRTYGKGTKWEGTYTGGLDKKYIQVLDIDLSGYPEEGWNPIGTFTGTYDGGNYVITGLEVKGEGKDEQGLFGRTQGATLRNVALEDVNITGARYVGGLAGDAGKSKIENSYATGLVMGSRYNVGGLVGRVHTDTEIINSYATGSVEGASDVGGLLGGTETLYKSNVKVINSYATGSVTGDSKVGGLVGFAYYGNISNSYTTGSVTGLGDNVGGLVGNNRSITIENSYATGEVTGSSRVGGLAGRAWDNTTISNSYATGPVTGSGDVGGLVGRDYGGSNISSSYATGEVTGTGTGERNPVGGLVGYAAGSNISNSYATGSVTGIEEVGGLLGRAGSLLSNGKSYDAKIINSYATGKVTGSRRVGGLVGYAYSNNKITISNSYWNKDTTGRSTSAGSKDYGRRESRTTDEMMNKDTYLDWNFDIVWKIDGNDYPKLR